MKNFHSLKIVSLLITTLLILNACSKDFFKPGDARVISPDPRERVKKNLEEGKGFRLNDAIKRGVRGRGGDFEFASSNELWRASLDIIEFMPLTSADYGGGLIITDWYSDENNSKDSVKISIRFLSNEIRADALKINVFSKECEREINCKVSQSNPKIENELKVAILKRAAKYKKDIVETNKKRPLNTILTSDDR